MSRNRSDFHLLDKPPKAIDAAAAAHPRVDGIAPRAQPMIAGLQIEIAVEIEGRAVAVEGRPNPPALREQEIDVVGSRQQRAADRTGVDALEAFALHPLGPLHGRPPAHRYAEEQILLD